MWKNWNLEHCWWECKNGVAAIEDSMKVLQKKIKNRTARQFRIPTSEYLCRDLTSVSQKDTSTPMFIVALSTKCGNSLNVHQQVNGKENMVYTYNGILFSLILKANSTI